jgi:hypothetical protein
MVSLQDNESQDNLKSQMGCFCGRQSKAAREDGGFVIVPASEQFDSRKINKRRMRTFTFFIPVICYQMRGNKRRFNPLITSNE